jgi:hypothetical protein
VEDPRKLGTPPSYRVSVGHRCKRCSRPLVGEDVYYVQIRQMIHPSRGVGQSDLCVGCLGQLLLQDEGFVEAFAERLIKYLDK